jgi:hypothetical protein
MTSPLRMKRSQFLRPNDSAFLLRATMPAAHAVCDSDVDPASSKCLLESVPARPKEPRLKVLALMEET